ncbi:rCG63424 [Rattus norvegicus]|uniref:RCG63424 n=1 Tax=Rattus norvegicus TaxID=10116 RepID=A6IMF9_RAT|nr:rCG63424 [Rattus norvegicus]
MCFWSIIFNEDLLFYLSCSICPSSSSLSLSLSLSLSPSLLQVPTCQITENLPTSLPSNNCL